MRAAQYDGYGGPAVLQVRSVPVPEVRPGHVLIRVAATSVNAADVTIRSGEIKVFSGRRFPRGTGFDFTGHVAAVGAGVSGLDIDASVWGFLNGIKQGPSAAAADYVLAPVSAVAAAPRSIDLVSAAALPGAAGAALIALDDHGRLHRGQRVLIRGASGGVGSAAVQLANAMGAHVVALARAEHHDALQELGAEATVDYRTVDLATLGRFDVILDTVGLQLRRWRRLLAPGGRYLNLALGKPADLAYLGASAAYGPRRIRVFQAPPDGATLSKLARWVDDGALRPVIAHTHPLSEIGLAHQAVADRGALGKQVVVITSTHPQQFEKSVGDPGS